MVLKDWKKHGSKKTLIYWERTSDGLLIQIEKPNHRHSTFQVFIYYTNNKKPTITVERNTEASARREVNNYMRTH